MRLIDADKLMDTILLQDGVNTKTWEQVFKFTIRAIDNAPTIDCPSRPHGKWIKHEWGYSCSVCGVLNDYAYDNNIHKFTDYYCPNCGAKMENMED